MSEPRQPLPAENGRRLHRTTVYVDALEGADVICTPAGVDAPPRSVSIDVRDFPDSMQHDIEAGKVFFAYVDLAARWPGPIHVERIEEPWGETGPLHFAPDGTGGSTT